MAGSMSISINTSNAAFADCEAYEVARILRELAQRLENNGMESEIILRDINGNKVGTAKSSKSK